MVKSGNPFRNGEVRQSPSAPANLSVLRASALVLSCVMAGKRCGSLVLLPVFGCRFSGGFSEDFLALRNFFEKKVVEKFGGDLESAYLCTRFRKPAGPEGPAEGLEQ